MPTNADQKVVELFDLRRRGLRDGHITLTLNASSSNFRLDGPDVV